MLGVKVMLEKQYTFTKFTKKLVERIVERIIEDEHAGINHIILPKGDALPEHYTNSNTYMLVINGTVTLQLADQEEQSYPYGSIITIPYNVKMNVSNKHDELLEIFVIKAPSPRTMKIS
jgi:quercetin dioxygenase-like cupin family protein